MEKIKSALLLGKADYEIIMACLKTGKGRYMFNRQDAEELEAELKGAKLVRDDKLPPTVVRLNSKVTIQEHGLLKKLTVTIVVPEKADIKQNKISLMSPIGTALIGLHKGQKVSWNVPAGKKTFSILEVQHL